MDNSVKIPETLSLARWVHDNPTAKYDIGNIPAEFLNTTNTFSKLQLLNYLRENGVYVTIETIRFKSGVYYLDCDVSITPSGDVTLGYRDQDDIRADMDYLEGDDW